MRAEGKADCLTQEQCSVGGRAELKARADVMNSVFLHSSLILSFYSA